jgi:hypothetical protein
MRLFGKVVAAVREEPAKYWSWREELNLQPVVYKLGPAESNITELHLTQGKTEEPKEPSS